MSFIDLNVLFHATQHSELGFHANALGMGAIDHTFCDFDILLEGLVRCIDHDRAVETGFDAIVAGFFVSMIEMDGKNGFGKYLLGRAQHRFEHAFIGVFPSAFGKLHDERRLALHVAAEQTQNLFHVVNVIGADGEFTVGDLVELSGGDDHKMKMSILG